MNRENMKAVNPFVEDYHNLDIEELTKIIKKYWTLSVIKKKERNNREFIIKFIDDYIERVNKRGDAFRED